MADQLVIRGAREHNLKDISLDLPRDRLIVLTGLSGSGKSSLAFDTIYAEGQRRYVESLSAYARQFLGQMDKPDVDFIEGLSPAISIDQKSASRNPRSTVGTITEIYDYLRLLYARIGVPHCPKDGTVVNRQTPQQIVDRILELPEGTRFQVLAPVVRGRKGTYDTLLADLATQGFARVRLDGEIRELAELASQGAELARYEMHTIEVVVDRLVLREGIERRLTDSLETALQLAEGIAEIELVPRDGEGLSDEEREVLTFSQHLACPTCGTSYGELAPRNFSFNSPYGACDHLRRARHQVRGRPRADRAQPRPQPGGGRHRALGQRPQPVLQAPHRGRRARTTTSRSTWPWRELPDKAHQAAPQRRRGQAGPRQVQEPLRPLPQLPRQVRGGRPVPAAPPRRGRVRQRPRADRGLHAGGGLPRVRRGPAACRCRWR